jgi:hypothetical protein
VDGLRPADLARPPLAGRAGPGVWRTARPLIQLATRHASTAVVSNHGSEE